MAFPFISDSRGTENRGARRVFGNQSDRRAECLPLAFLGGQGERSGSG